MARRVRTRRPALPHTLESKPYTDMFKETKALAISVLAHYGESTLTLEQLRERVRASLGDESLSDWILQDRAESR